MWNDYRIDRTPLLLVTLLAALSLAAPLAASSFSEREEGALLPAEVAGERSWSREGEARVFPPETMYEEVNGEAELYKRYGARALHSAVYFAAAGSGEGGRARVELLDCGLAKNAYGLFRLYSGCGGEAEERTEGEVRLVGGGPSAFGIRSFRFVKVSMSGGKADAERFLAQLLKGMAPPAGLPAAALALEKLARRPCEVTWVPDHLDFSLASGPGWRWKDGEGRDCMLALTAGEAEAEALKKRLAKRATGTAFRQGSAVAWTGDGSPGAPGALRAGVEAVLGSGEGAAAPRESEGGKR